jgi:hypothetical protein
MHRGMADEQYQPVLWQHCYGGQHTSKQEVIQLFEENAKHLAIRKNGNVLYHEIISFSAGHALTQAILTQLVADVGQEYLRQRAPTQLAYGVVHFDTEHIHLHLMISANSVGRPERVRLSKQRFAEIQQQLEHFVMTRFPELEQTQVYRDKAQGERCKLRAKEQAMTLRAKAPSRKEDLARRLADIFGQAYSQADFEYRCRAEGVRIYQRGNSLGVLVHEVDGAERNHRLSTLGVMHAYEAMQDRFLEHVSDEISHL